MFKDTAAKDTAAKVMGFGQALTELTVRDEVVKASAAPIFVAAPSRRCEWRAIDVVLTNLNARRGPVRRHCHREKHRQYKNPERLLRMEDTFQLWAGVTA
ncbi:MAG: hypothetical protein ACXW3R_09975 [Rhodoplanes sp.]|jgi:hypothetical protein